MNGTRSPTRRQEGIFLKKLNKPLETTVSYMDKLIQTLLSHRLLI